MNSGTARHGTLLLSAFCRFPRRARLCPRKSRRHSESGRRSGRDLKHASEANYVTQRNGADVRLGGVLVWWRRPRKPSRWGTLPETPMPRGRGRGRGGKRSSPGIASAACFSTCARTILGSGAGGGGGKACKAQRQQLGFRTSQPWLARSRQWQRPLPSRRLVPQRLAVLFSALSRHSACAQVLSTARFKDVVWQDLGSRPQCFPILSSR